MFHFLFITAIGIGNVQNSTFQFIFRQPFHYGGGLLVQRATAEILRDRIHAAIVDRPNRMIVRKLSLLSAFEIADLSASAPTLIPRSKSSAVFGLPCIRDQKPLAANRA